MSVPVNKIRENSMSKINSLNITQNKESFQYKSRSDAAKPQGKLEEEIFDLYYDVNNTISTPTSTDPLDAESSVYNIEKVFEHDERNAPYIWVANDAPSGGANLFVICLHGGEGHSSKERPIPPQQFKVYKNVYEIRLRSASAINYRVSEYELGAS